MCQKIVAYFSFLWNSSKTVVILTSILIAVSIFWIASLSWDLCTNPFQLAQKQEWGYLYVSIFNALAQFSEILLGFLGVFVVYRLQVQHDRIRDQWRDIRNFCIGLVAAKDTNPLRVGVLPEDKLIGFACGIIDNWPSDLPKSEANKTLSDLERTLKNQKYRREETKNWSLPVVILLALVTILDILLIGQGELFGKTPIIGTPLTLCVFVLTVITVGLTLWFLYLCIRHE